MSDAGRLVLGTAQWGLAYGIANRLGPPDSAELGRIVATAAAAGVHTVDTARAYGSAEAVAGAALDADWRVVTKLAPDVAGPDVDAGEARRRALASLAASRAALRRDRLDTVLLHRADHRTASGGAAWSVLREEHVAGRIGSIGASVVSVVDAPALLDDSSVAVIQVPASLLDRRLRHAGFFERAAARGREVFVRSIFLQGAGHLGADELPDHLAALGSALRALDELGARAGLSRAALFLAWARERLGTARVIIGCETAAQLEANLAAWNRTVSEDLIRACEERVPELPDAVLDPWRWPSRSAG